MHFNCFIFILNTNEFNLKTIICWYHFCLGFFPMCLAKAASSVSRAFLISAILAWANLAVFRAAILFTLFLTFSMSFRAFSRAAFWPSRVSFNSLILVFLTFFSSSQLEFSSSNFLLWSPSSYSGGPPGLQQSSQARLLSYPHLQSSLSHQNTFYEKPNYLQREFPSPPRSS